MSTTLLIRDVPDDVRHELEARASRDGRSLSEYVLALLRREAGRLRRQSAVARLRELGAVMPPRSEPAWETIRRMRDDRR